MTENKIKSILVLSNDTTVKDAIACMFCDCEIDYFAEDKFNGCSLKDYAVILLDEIDIDIHTLDRILKLSNIINISQKCHENMINLTRPFSLYDLCLSIHNLLLKEEEIIKFKNFKIANSALNLNNSEILFGNKEISLIKYLIHNSSASKKELLKNIWNYNEEMETKVLENTINKIKQKLKSINIPDFIVSNGGKYMINEIYRLPQQL